MILRLFNKTISTVFILLVLWAGSAFGWHDETHLAVAKAAGYSRWYNTTGADLAKIKAGGIESYNHFFNNPGNIEVTPAVVFSQIGRYNNANHTEGHLYGAVMASFREYKKAFEEKKYAEYHLAYFAHYVTDLSQPLHNVPYDAFNRSRHSRNDGIVNKGILMNIDKIYKHMYSLTLGQNNFEEALAREVAGIADRARRLALKLKKEKRDMTKEEAYIQLGQSASLLKAVLKHLGKYQDN